jgi:4-methyl-5(b-hydroxyethyl)-thiazole monophosphate biosynthesis
MKQAFLFLAPGFEEIEAVGTIDILRRAGVSVSVVSVSGNRVVPGAHALSVEADVLFEQADFSSGDLLVLPGGMPGASNLNAHEGLKKQLLQYASSGKLIAAICAAPLVFGGLGLLQGKRATCYPGFESQLTGATVTGEAVVRDGNIITGQGPGKVFAFGLALVEALLGQAAAYEVAEGMLLVE